MSDTKYAYSFTGEEYEGPFDSYDEAYWAARKDPEAHNYSCCYIGEVCEYEPRVSASAVLETVQDDAYDQCGDFAIDYLDDVKKIHKQELGEMLTKVFNDWAEEYGYKPPFFTVENVRKVIA